MGTRSPSPNWNEELRELNRQEGVGGSKGTVTGTEGRLCRGLRHNKVPSEMSRGRNIFHYLPPQTLLLFLNIKHLISLS